MKAILSLEFIGANSFDQIRRLDSLSRVFGEITGKAVDEAAEVAPCVVEISKVDGSLTTTKVFGDRDYSKANSVGSRGVMVRFVLHQDKLYYVRDRVSWKSVVDYYCTVNDDGSIFRLTDEQMTEWVNEL